MEECPDDVLTTFLKWLLDPRMLRELRDEPAPERVAVGDPLVLGSCAYRTAHVIHYKGKPLWIDRHRFLMRKLALVREMIAA